MKKQLILLALAIAAVCANAQDVIHQVKRGETLESIAGTYGVPAEEILKANPNMGGRFYAGMKIAIPNQNNESATPKAPTTVIYQTEVAEETQQPKTNRRRENRKKQSDKYYGTRQGGFALSFGAAPVINFIGNMFNGTTNQSFEGFKGLGSDLFNGATISGKYMLRDNWALTAGIGFNNSKEEKITYSDPENKEKETGSNISGSNKCMFMVGAQYLLRPGKRLQPILGLNIAYARTNNNFSTNEDNSGEESSKTERNYPANTFGLLANVGVEFFVCKSISLSATVDLGVSKTKTKEKYDNGDDVKYDRLSSTHTEFKTGQFGGNFAVNFYF